MRSVEYAFQCECKPYHVAPIGESDSEKGFFTIPLEGRKKIAKHVKSICESAFANYFGERLKQINEIKRIQARAKEKQNRFIVVTVTGWLLAILLAVLAYFF